MEDAAKEVEDQTAINGSDNGRDARGRFLPGNPGKPFGSSRNQLRNEIKSFLSDRWQDFPQWFDQLSPDKKIKTVLELLPFAVSKLATVTMKEDPEPKAVINYSKLSEETLKEILDNTIHETNQ